MMQVRKITLKHVKGTEFKDDKGRQWKFYKVPGQSKAAADKVKQRQDMSPLTRAGGETDMDRYTKEQLLGYVILAAKALNYTKEQISGNISYQMSLHANNH